MPCVVCSEKTPTTPQDVRAQEGDIQHVGLFCEHAAAWLCRIANQKVRWWGGEEARCESKNQNSYGATEHGWMPSMNVDTRFNDISMRKKKTSCCSLYNPCAFYFHPLDQHLFFLCRSFFPAKNNPQASVTVEKRFETPATFRSSQRVVLNKRGQQVHFKKAHVPEWFYPKGKWLQMPQGPNSPAATSIA